MPPQSSADYDLQLENTMRDLSQLREDMAFDVAFVFCTEDAPEEEVASHVHPCKIMQDLCSRGFKWLVLCPTV